MSLRIFSPRGRSSVRFFLAGLALWTVGASLSPAATKQEVERAERLATEGDAVAQVAFGIMQENGDGVPANPTEASKWYRRAAEQNNGDGAFRLGWLYARGEGLPQSAEQAVQWYERAAKRGHSVAQLSLGWMYFNGHGVPRDISAAARWFQLAAEQGDPSAQYTLGTIFSGTYDDVPADMVAAAKWYRQAADQGIAGAQYQLGELYARGTGVAPDDTEAGFWLSLAVPRLPDGTFKTAAEKSLATITARLSATRRAEVARRVAAWEPKPLGG